MATQKWVLEIDGNSTGAQNAVGGLNAKTVAMGNILSNLATGAFNMLTSAVGDLAGKLLKSVDMASAAQESQMSLASAMQQAGTYTKAAFQANLDYASALQKVSTYGDDDINRVQKALTVYGLEGETLNAVTKAAVDLAAAKAGEGMSLANAGELVAKSIGTARNSLKAFGVELTDTTDRTEKAKQIVEGISNLYGGAAAAATQTFSGKVKQLKETWNDLYEEIGFVITNNKGLAEVFDILKGAIERATKWVGDHKQELATLVRDGIVFVIKSIGYLVEAFDFLQSTSNTVGNAMMTTFLGAYKVISTVASVIGMISAKKIAEELDLMTDAILETKEAGDALSKQRKEFAQQMISEINQMAANIAGVKTVYTETTDAVNGLGKAQGENTESALTSSQILLDNIRGFTDAEFEQYVERLYAYKDMLANKKISQEEFDAWLITAGTKVQSEEAKQLAARKAQNAFFASTIVAISTAQSDALLSGQKSLGTALEDAWKKTAKALIDAFIDEKVKEIVLAAAGETGKATVAAPMSLGTSLLLIPLIAAAATVAKAAIHALAGFSEGGIVGPGGSRIPFPSMGGGGGGPDNAIARVRTGEVIGTPQQIAAAGIGGVVVNFNNYGAIGSNADIENLGIVLGKAIQNKLRGSI